MGRYLILIFLMFFGINGYGQIVVIGKVIDENGNGLAYANVVFKGTTVGTYSDDNGNFSLKYTKKGVLEVSLLGYSTEEIKIKESVKGLKVVLREGEQLAEVTVVGKPKKHLSKKENPAYKILQKIWANKDKSSLKKVKFYEYRKYTSTELGLNNLDSVFLKKAIGNQKDYRDIRNTLSEKKYKQYFSVPMYMNEEVRHVYGNNVIRYERSDIEAERSQGIYEQGYGLERITNSLKDYNVYENSIMVLNKPFVSPVSEYGYGVYSYVLNDSIERNNQKFYTIYFFPREEQDLLFQGYFVVGSKNYAIEKIQMNTTKETNVNLVRSLSMEKNYKVLENGEFIPDKDVIEGDFTMLSKDDEEKGMYLKKTITYTDFKFGDKKSDDFYSHEIQRYKSGQFKREDSYWDSIPVVNEEKSKTELIIKKVGRNRSIRRITGAIDMLTSGYVNVGSHFQFGNIYSAYSRNDVEGARIKLGGRSFFSSEDSFRTYFYGAYGMRDKEFKYGVSAKYLALSYPRLTIGGMYQYDNLQLGSLLQTDDSDLSMKNYANFWFSRGENYFLTRSKKLQGMADLGFMGSNLHMTIAGQYQRINAADGEHFSINYVDENGVERSMYSDATVSVGLSFTPKRNVYGYGVEQRFQVPGTYQEYKIRYSKGIAGIRNSSLNYSKLEGSISYPFALWSLGHFRPRVEAGKVFGKVPLPMLTATPANQTYSSARNTFALLDYYDFVADTYVNLHVEHHFNGFIFNRIPLFRKLKLREIVFAKAAWGTISDENKAINRSNIIYNSPEKVYWEYGFGISNIGYGNFRPVRLDFVWRNGFRNVNGGENPNFGIRISMIPEF